MPPDVMWLFPNMAARLSVGNELKVRELSLVAVTLQVRAAARKGWNHLIVEWHRVLQQWLV